MYARAVWLQQRVRPVSDFRSEICVQERFRLRGNGGRRELVGGETPSGIGNRKRISATTSVHENTSPPAAHVSDATEEKPWTVWLSTTLHKQKEGTLLNARERKRREKERGTKGG
jgi:hypothetical protein